MVEWGRSNTWNKHTTKTVSSTSVLNILISPEVIAFSEILLAVLKHD